MNLAWAFVLSESFSPIIHIKREEVRKTSYCRSPRYIERQFMKFYCHHLEVRGVRVRGVPALNVTEV